MGNFQLPRTTLLDTDGVPIPNGTVEFYLAGTSTPMTVYNDSDLTSAIGTSVTADADGRCQNVWSDEEIPYKVIVKNAASAEIYTEDDIRAYGTVGGASFSYMNKIASHPLLYGAIGDGAADESSAVQSAITNATGTVDLLGLTYKCNSAITVPSNRRVINGTLDFSACTDANLIVVGPGNLGGTLSLTSDCEVGATSVTLSTGDAATLSVGSWIRISSSVTWDGLIAGGEICRVKGISGVTVSLAEQTIGKYAVASTGAVNLITAVDGVTFEGVDVIAADTGAQNCLTARYSENVVVKNCTFTGFKTSGVLLETSVSPIVEGCRFTDGQSNSIGVSVEDGSINASVTDCSFYDIETGVSCSSKAVGVVRFAKIANNAISYSKYGIYMESMTHYCSASGNIVRCGSNAVSAGIVSEGRSNSITHNIVRHAQAYAIRGNTLVSADYTTPVVGNPASTDANGVVFTCTGNVIELCNSYGIHYTQQTGTYTLEYGIIIDGNNISGSDSDHAIKVDCAYANVTGVKVNNNSIRDFAEGISISVASGREARGVTVNGNHVDNLSSVGTGVSLSGAGADDIKNASVTGNSTRNLANGIVLSNVNTASVVGNTVYSSNTYGISVSGSIKAVAITGNSITEANDGINIGAVTAVNGVVISGNTIKDSVADAIGMKPGIASATNLLLISDNYIDTPAAKAFNISTASAATATKITVSNNVIEAAGAVSLFDSVDNLTITGNSFHSSVGSDLDIDDCDSVTISQNVFNTPGAVSIDIDLVTAAFVDYVISGNTFTSTAGGFLSLVQNTGADLTGLVVSGNSLVTTSGSCLSWSGSGAATLKNVSISGNTMKSNLQTANFAIATTAVLTECIISGNSIEETALTSAAIEFSGAGSATYIAIMSNFLKGGDYSIESTASTTTKLVAGANLITGYATGASTGTTYAATSTTAADLPSFI